MRLWHDQLIPHLPRQQLLGQHRECCALRGNGWLKKHSVINYIFKEPPSYLFAYHERIMNEMNQRGYNVDPLWRNPFYRGKKSELFSSVVFFYGETTPKLKNKNLVYKEHNMNYLEECLLNLQVKGIDLYKAVSICKPKD